MKATLMKIGKAAVLAMALPLVSSAAEAAKAAEAKRLNAEAVALMQKGDLTGAISGFKAALDADPACMESVHNLGKLLIAGRAYDNARIVLEKGLEACPDDEGCLLQMLQLTALTNARKDFSSCLDRIAKLPDSAILKDSPILLLRQGSKDCALEAAECAVRTKGKDRVCWYNRGVVLEALGRENDAVDSYERSVALDRKYALAWINLGSIRDRQEKTDEAIAAFEKALAADPDNGIAQYNLGRLLVISKRDIDRGVHLLCKATNSEGAAGMAAKDLLAKLLGLGKKGGAK